MKRLWMVLGCLSIGTWVWANISITQGSGTTIGTDSAGGVNYQQIKLCDGAAGSTTCFSTAPVNINNQPTVNQGTAGTAAWLVTMATVSTSGSPIFTYLTNPTTTTVSVTATTTDITTAPVNGVYPGVMAAVGGIGTSGNFQGFKVAGSSHQIVDVSIGNDTQQNAYSASTQTFTIGASTQDVAAICGNATNVVLVYGIRASCTQTTAGIIPITIAKRSSIYTGSFSTMTSLSLDANYAGAISSVTFFTSQGLTNGTLLGYVDSGQIGCMAAATASPNDIYLSPSAWKNKPIVLRAATQCLGINFQGASMSGAKITAAFDWIETGLP